MSLNSKEQPSTGSMEPWALREHDRASSGSGPAQGQEPRPTVDAGPCETVYQDGLIEVKVLILGSTGATGRILTSLALQRGHDVRVLVRDTTQNVAGGTEVLAGDARSPESVKNAMAGIDVTVSALGMGLNTTPNGLMVDATRALIHGAIETGNDRVIMLSSWGVGGTLKQSSLPIRLLYRPGRNVHAEKAEAETVLRASQLDWTLVYPVALTNRSASGKVRAVDLTDQKRMCGVPRISRADVAQYLLEVAEQGTWSRRTVVLRISARRYT